MPDEQGRAAEQRKLEDAAYEILMHCAIYWFRHSPPGSKLDRPEQLAAELYYAIPANLIVELARAFDPVLDRYKGDGPAPR